MPFKIVFKSFDKEGKMGVVNYSYNGAARVAKIPTWTTEGKEILKLLSTADEGDTFNVSTRKDGAFTIWESVTRGTGISEDADKQQGPATNTRSGGNWETHDERARKQVYIIKQSSIGSAIETLKSRDGPFGAPEVLDLAKVYTDWVLDISTDKDFE